MKTLPEALRDVMLLLGEGRDTVVITRGNHEPLDGCSAVFQIRIRHDGATGMSAYRCEGRSWLGGQWSNWDEQRGWLGRAAFDIRDVLSTDWRIIS